MGPPETAQAGDDFLARLRDEGRRRYHDEHPFHVRMHQGALSRRELALWVANRYYYQTRIPIKDAIILSKSEDPAFRRSWIHRLHDHDGCGDEPGGLSLWLRLATSVGLDEAQTANNTRVLPGVRFACDAYVSLVRDSPLVVAVASSLTEMFAPDIMTRRIAAWEQHYPWVDKEGLAYFRARVTRARRDGDEALAWVMRHACTRELQDACVAALVRKTEILWHLLDAVEAAAAGRPLSGGAA